MDKTELIDMMNEFCPYCVYNGIKVQDVGEGFCSVVGELRPESLNPWGMAHGGFIYSLCDVAAGVAASLDGRRGVTLSGNMQYLRASAGSRLRAEGRITKDGRNVVFIDTQVFDEGGKLTARGSFEVFVLPKEGIKL